jgi:DNA-binding protein HU-beta
MTVTVEPLQIGGNPMNKSDLAKSVSDKTGLSRAQAGEAVDAAIDAIIGSVKGNDSVQLAGFGTFFAKHREAREVRNPRTGEKMMSKAKTQAAFRPAAALKDI